MTVKTASGTKMWIGTQVTSAVDTAPEFSALTWTLIGEVENYGEFGDESSAVTFASVGEARVRKAKGARDAGTMALVCGKDPLDTGQLALRAAQRTNFEYAFKIEEANAPTAGYTNSIHYFRGLVMSSRDNIGTNDNIVRSTFSIGVNSEPIEVPVTTV